MKREDLHYWNEVIGRKPHFIFKQSDCYYVLTEQDEGTRGNFTVIREAEVVNTRKSLSGHSIPELFHCDKICHLISGLDLQLNNENKDHYISRLFNICYILVALDYLTIKKEGRFILFQKRSITKPSTDVLSTKAPLSEHKPCYLCGVNVKQNRMTKHLEKCPKRPVTSAKIPSQI